MIRQKTLTDIKQSINNHSKFNSSDFLITSKVDKVTIKYEYEQSYFLEVEIPSRTNTITKEKTETVLMKTVVDNISYEDYQFYGRVSPGNLTLVENFHLYGEKNFYKLLSKWLDDLWSELLAIPLNRHFENQEKIIEEIKNRLNNIPDAYFEFEEAEEIKRKIDALEKQFEEKLNNEIKDKEKLKAELNELHNEFNNLKNTIHSVKKKGWFKSFVTKTFIWVSKEENRKFLKDTKEFIGPLLPENVKNILP